MPFSHSDLQRKLLRTESAFDSTFENAAIGIAHVGLDGSWLRVNETLCRVVGHSPEALLKMTFQDITHPDDLETDLGHVDQVIAGEIPHYAMDKRYRRADGTYVWARLTVSLNRQANGEPDFFISMVEDIDDRKRTEAENMFLNQELAHRSRNLLSVIGAMTSLLAPSCTSVAEFEERLQNRIQAISRANDLLIGGKWEGAQLRDLVKSQLGAFLGDRADAVSVEGPDLFINSKCAQCLSLALCELASNALKYGAFSSPGGHLKIAWSTSGSGAESRYRLVWQEVCAHPVSPSERVGFGTTVLTTMAPMAVLGSAETVYRPEGLEWVLSAPTQAILPIGG